MNLFDRPKKNEPADPPVLRIAPGTEPIEVQGKRAQADADPSISVRMDVATARFLRPNQGPAICNSLEEDGTRSSVRIPKGMTDIDALDALNAESLTRYRREIFCDESIRQLAVWAKNHQRGLSHLRTYSVVLFVDETANRDAFKAERVLDKMRLEPGIKLAPADPVEVAIVLAAHVLGATGETRANTLCIRTASSEMSFSYIETSRMIHLVKRDAEVRNPNIVMAATAVTAPERSGLFEFAKTLFGFGKAS
jgi:hypothetical protein